MGPRRTPAALITSLMFHKNRRYLFVEGPRDRRFLAWAAGKTSLCTIEEIGDIDIRSPLRGGNRARAVWLADYFREELATAELALQRVRVLVDADFDHFDRRHPILPLMITDGRSMEAYWLRPDYFERMFRFAIIDKGIDHNEIFDATVTATLQLAALREVDRQRSLELALQGLNTRSYVDVDGSGKPSLRLDDMVSNLLGQNRIHGKHASGFRGHIEAVLDELGGLDPMEVVHGHDLEAVVGEVLQCFGLHRDNVQEMMRATFERCHISEYPRLSAVVAFIRSE